MTTCRYHENGVPVCDQEATHRVRTSRAAGDQCCAETAAERPELCRTHAQRVVETMNQRWRAGRAARQTPRQAQAPAAPRPRRRASRAAH